MVKKRKEERVQVKSIKEVTRGEKVEDGIRTKVIKNIYPSKTDDYPVFHEGDRLTLREHELLGAGIKKGGFYYNPKN